MDREANRSTDRAAHPPQQGNEDNSSGTGYYTLKAVHSPHTDGESLVEPPLSPTSNCSNNPGTRVLLLLLLLLLLLHHLLPPQPD